MIIKLTEHLTANELVCRCGKCKYSDPAIIPHIIDRDLLDKFECLRLALGVPILINRGVSCPDHHIHIYKSVYGDAWEQHITWDSKHLVHESVEQDHTVHKFYAIDTKPLTNNYERIKMVCAYFRFHGIGHYKKTYKNGVTNEDHFLHLDTGYPLLRYYTKTYFER